MQAVLLSPESPIYMSDSQLPHVCTVLAQGLLCKEEQFGACVQLAVLRIDVTSPLVCFIRSTDCTAFGLNNDDSLSYETDCDGLTVMIPFLVQLALNESNTCTNTTSVEFALLDPAGSKVEP